MSSPGSREVVLTARENIERYLQHCNRSESNGEPGEGRGKTPRAPEPISNEHGLQEGLASLHSTRPHVKSSTMVRRISSFNSMIIMSFEARPMP
jgi:hypothetical protein